MLLPSAYSTTAPARLLAEAALGFIGWDHRLLRALTSQPEETLAALHGILFEPPSEPRVSLAYHALNLYRHFRHRSAARFYCDLLAGFGTEVPDFMVEAFCELGADAVDPLLDYVQSADEDHRPEALFILATLGVRDPRILAELERLLEKDIYEGSLFLGVYGDPAGEPALDRALSRLSPYQKDEQRILRESKGQLRQGGVKRDLPPFDLLAEYPESAEPVWEVLSLDEIPPFLTCEESEWRGSAALSLTSREDYTVKEARFILAALDQETDPAVRGLFHHALFPVAADPEIRARLEAALNNESLSSTERGGALVGLAYHNQSAAFRRRVEEFFARDETLSAAMTAALLSNDDHYAPVYARHLAHPDGEVRRCAVTGVGKHRQKEHAARLMELFADDDADVREEALFAYVLAGIPRVTRKNAEALLEDIEELAGGLSTEEAETVEGALDLRLQEAGFEPVFLAEEDSDEEPPVETRVAEKIGRNDPCPCGSGKKYKKCHGL